MPTRSADAMWNGTLKEGAGSVALESGAYEGPYSFASRFDEADETNPEELIGAAHASCFAMALSLGLSDAGYEPERIVAEAQVHLDPDELAITRIDLTVEGNVPNTDEDTFLEHAEGAKENCPVSKALAGTEIGLTATLLD
jgi:osmotically inducible protein OsmC